MHGAFDPNGYGVWCDFANQEAWANNGFCQFCGSTEHERINPPVAGSTTGGHSVVIGGNVAGDVIIGNNIVKG